MSSSIILQFEEAAREALLMAEALQADASAARAGTPDGDDSAAWPTGLSEAWRWLNTPVSLSDILPKDSGGFSKRK